MPLPNIFLFPFLVFRLNATEYMSRRVDRMVFMVIDALRTDFIENSERWPMPYTNKQLQEGNACLYNIQVESPTVTMPRIKAMTTGTIPNFVDVILNLGSSAVTTDSFISQLKSQDRGNRAYFAGDITWLKMFPNGFDGHSANNDSMFVNDFYNVSV